MALRDIDRFVILLNDGDVNDLELINVVKKLCLKSRCTFNNVKINSKICYIVYNINKEYLWDLGANKKLKFIWKDRDDFYIVNFKNNTKGDVISHLTFDVTTGEKIEGQIEYINIKSKYKKINKLPLVSSKLIDENEPYTYQPFIFYTTLGTHNQK
jgi:hypothetical protein